jgi:ankyrin repeat protein
MFTWSIYIYDRMLVLTYVTVSQEGETGLHHAADRGHVEIVKMLLQCERFNEVNAYYKVRHEALYMLLLIFSIIRILTNIVVT